ncbi:hypothetical protein GY45DRAFT_657958 [Cubamyces sp. BRFM 1775]|nr:hypothetical protein GY45DRAFT_657958 [Cubamyces sp. BRFM 1775]
MRTRCSERRAGGSGRAGRVWEWKWEWEGQRVWKERAQGRTPRLCRALSVMHDERGGLIGPGLGRRWERGCQADARAQRPGDLEGVQELRLRLVVAGRASPDHRDVVDTWVRGRTGPTYRGRDGGLPMRLQVWGSEGQRAGGLDGHTVQALAAQHVRHGARGVRVVGRRDMCASGQTAAVRASPNAQSEIARTRGWRSSSAVPCCAVQYPNRAASQVAVCCPSAPGGREVQGGLHLSRGSEAGDARVR